MEQRQRRYFASVVELGGMGRAAAQLGVVTIAPRQQISRREGKLSTRLLIRTSMVFSSALFASPWRPSTARDGCGSGLLELAETC